MPSNNIAVSIIVPCYNSANFISRTLAALTAEISLYDDVELLLVDNNSTDNTVSLLDSIATPFNAQTGREAIRVLKATTGQGVNVARNAGATQANGSILLFTDHDDAVCASWLGAFREAFARGAQIVTGPYSEFDSNGELISEVNTPELHHWAIPYGLGSNSGILRTGFTQIGGFDESYQGGGDDADFFWRAHFTGMELTFVPDARIIHYLRDNEKASFKQFVGYGKSAVRLYVKFRDQGMPRSSTLRAVLAWPLALAEVAASYLLPHRAINRRRAISRLGVRWGRLSESLRLRARYL